MPSEISTQTERSIFFPFEIKALDAPGQFEGHAATFGNVDRQGDVIAPSAFERTLKDHGGKVPILFGHFGRPVGYGIDAHEDGKGLKVVGEFTLDSDDGRNAYASAKHAAKIGAKLGLSIGYLVRKNGAEWDEQSGVRTLKDLELVEYSIAPVPANPRATISRVKSSSVRELEGILRSAGMSQEEAATFLALAKSHRDGEASSTSDGHRDGERPEAIAQLMSSARLLGLKLQTQARG